MAYLSHIRPVSCGWLVCLFAFPEGKQRMNRSGGGGRAGRRLGGVEEDKLLSRVLYER